MKFSYNRKSELCLQKDSAPAACRRMPYCVIKNKFKPRRKETNWPQECGGSFYRDAGDHEPSIKYTDIGRQYKSLVITHKSFPEMEKGANRRRTETYKW